MSKRFTITDIERSPVAAINRHIISPAKHYAFLIGIDCGVKTGFAVYDPATKTFAELSTLKIHAAMERVRYWSQFSVFVRVEDARQRKWIPRQANERAERGRREGAGSVKRDAVIWHDFLTDMGIDHEMVAPKNNTTKITADYFCKITGHKGATSSHARDAAMLVFS